MAADGVFVDTNVLVYSTMSASPLFGLARQRLSEQQARPAILCISRQILREYVAVLTRPGATATPLTHVDVVRAARVLAVQYTLLEDGPTVTEMHFDLVERHGVSGRPVHDANIVATMLAHGVTRLLTHNGADFARYAGSIDVVSLA